MIVHAQENPGFHTQDLIIGSAIAVGCLVATVVLLVILLRDSWRILQSLIQTTVCVLRGEKPPWVRRREEIKRMREKVLSREEAIVRVQQYAQANGGVPRVHSISGCAFCRLRGRGKKLSRSEDLSTA